MLKRTFALLESLRFWQVICFLPSCLRCYTVRFSKFVGPSFEACAVEFCFRFLKREIYITTSGSRSQHLFLTFLSFFGIGLSNRVWVTGVEPAASWTPFKRATKLRYTQILPLPLLLATHYILSHPLSSVNRFFKFYCVSVIFSRNSSIYICFNVRFFLLYKKALPSLRF